MEEALASGGTALYLVPEISLASFLARGLIERFGSAVAILHSSMTEHERVRQWLRVARGGARVVIGPRSALFAPLPDLRLVVVDEEHDGSYKQQDFPRYHARDMAVIRAMLAGVPVVLGSATPSVESYYNATEVGKYSLLTLPERTGTAVLPPVQVVDMREEFRATGAKTTLSRALAGALQEELAQGRQAVLLRNRLGYATFVLCRQCGRTIQCEACAVAMTFHRKASHLKCHYCGRQIPIPQQCPFCGGEILQFLGEGTEKVEEAVAQALPGVRVARMDRDAVRTARAFDTLWRDFEAGRISVMAGTQMVAKGHDIPNVTLVGILSADFLLGLPDFRAAERTFQLITQAAGRAGRGRLPGRVVLQSFHPEHYAVQAATTHDFVSFYEKDIRYRKTVGYPPSAALARIEFRHADPAKVENLSRQAERHLRASADREVRLLGPVDPPIPRLEGRYRKHILLRSRERRRLQTLLAGLLEGPLGPHSGRDMLVEVDPYVLM
jgi:primosomal protein N' (replication factor Y)